MWIDSYLHRKRKKKKVNIKGIKAEKTKGQMRKSLFIHTCLCAFA